MHFGFEFITAVPKLADEVRGKLATAILAAAFVVAAVELQRHWGGPSTLLYCTVLLLIGLTGLGALWRQPWVIANVGWLIDILVFAQVTGGLALGQGSSGAGGHEMLREMLFWAPLVCAWWAVFYCGNLRQVLLRAGLLYLGLYYGGALDTPARFAHEYVIQGALAIGLVTLSLGLLIAHPEVFGAGAAAFDALAHDPLTGLASRAAFEAELEHVAAIAERQQQPFSLIMAKVDGLAADGHIPTLHAVAAAIAEKLRHADSACRWELGTFALLLPNTDKEEADIVAAKIAGAISTLRGADGTALAARIGVGEHRLGDDPLCSVTAVEGLIG